MEAVLGNLIEAGKLYAHRYTGFWSAMDTFKEKRMFDTMHDDDERPWEVWQPRRCRAHQLSIADGMT